jgi:hypothetical protein
MISGFHFSIPFSTQVQYCHVRHKIRDHGRRRCTIGSATAKEYLGVVATLLGELNLALVLSDLILVGTQAYLNTLSVRRNLEEECTEAVFERGLGLVTILV